MKYTGTALRRGMASEKREHADLARAIRKSGSPMKPEEVYFMIADAHLREDPDYYTVKSPRVNASKFRFRIGG